MGAQVTAFYRWLLQIVLVMAGQINREMLLHSSSFFSIPLPSPPPFLPPSHSSLVRRSRNSRSQNGGYQPNKQLENHQFGADGVSFSNYQVSFRLSFQSFSHLSQTEGEI